MGRGGGRTVHARNRVACLPLVFFYYIIVETVSDIITPQRCVHPKLPTTRTILYESGGFDDRANAVCPEVTCACVDTVFMSAPLLWTREKPRDWARNWDGFRFGQGMGTPSNHCSPSWLYMFVPLCTSIISVLSESCA